MCVKEIISNEIATVMHRVNILSEKQREFAQGLEAIESEIAAQIIPCRSNGQGEDLHGLHLVYRELEERLYLATTESNELMARLEDLEQEQAIVERMEDLAVCSPSIPIEHRMAESYAS